MFVFLGTPHLHRMNKDPTWSSWCLHAIAKALRIMHITFRQRTSVGQIITTHLSWFVCSILYMCKFLVEFVGGVSQKIYRLFLHFLRHIVLFFFLTQMTTKMKCAIFAGLLQTFPFLRTIALSWKLVRMLHKRWQDCLHTRWCTCSTMKLSYDCKLTILYPMTGLTWSFSECIGYVTDCKPCHTEKAMSNLLWANQLPTRKQLPTMTNIYRNIQRHALN